MPSTAPPPLPSPTPRMTISGDGLLTGRRSIIPQAGGGDEFTPRGRRSLVPRMSTMPSAPNKLQQQVPQISVTEYQAVKAESNRLRIQLEQSTEKLEEERTHRQRKEDECIVASRKISDYEMKLSKFQKLFGKHERKEKRTEDQQQEFHKILEEMQTTYTETLTTTTCDLEQRLREREEELRLYRDDANERVETLAIQLSETTEQLTLKMEQLDQNNAELQQLHEKTDELRSYRTDASNHIEQLTNQLNDTAEKLAHKTSQHAKDKKDSHHQHESHKKEMSVLKQQLVTLQTSLKVKHDEMHDAESYMNSLKLQVEESTDDITRMRSQIEGLRSEETDHEREIIDTKTSFEANVEALKDDLKDSKRRNGKHEKDITKYKNQILQANSKLEQASNEMDCLEEKVTDLDYKVRVEEHKAKKESLVADRLRDKLKLKQSDVDALKKSKKDLVKQANERIDDLNNEVKRLQNVANDYRGQYEIIRSRLERRNVRNGIRDRDEEHLRASIPVRRSIAVANMEEDDDAASSVHEIPTQQQSAVYPTLSSEQPQDESMNDTSASNQNNDLFNMEYKTLQNAAKSLGLKVCCCELL